ncbi:MipA/OmpV family protein [Erythrobacter sp. F6033]|uniref:MipA/OmpV family protein n=1 Tax=Erythrobacter sp. F6033 TaxID=2926401 RepID=UPI001FF5DA18|nr:MipA/OmpV family protein [Erythrobacter sp. F6033]MCK0127422.1 MipA/OmpV family protein [Erythrobacter sp. F6033]
MRNSIKPQRNIMRRLILSSFTLTALVCTPSLALAQQEERDGDRNDETSAEAVQGQPDATQDRASGPPEGIGSGGPPPGVFADSVFDETWLTVGAGAGLTPSYSGSDDYVVIPLPLIVGRVGGIGISPNGPGFNLDVLSQASSEGPPETSLSFGPTFRIRGDRNGQIKDPVVELAGDLDTALEVGVQGGVSFPGVLNRFDRVAISTAVRWDVLGAHDGMLIEPGVSYFTPLGRGAAVQIIGSVSFVDDSFADYYYSITPAQSTATGLPQFTAEGGLNSFGTTAIATVDLDGDVLNGGFNIYMVGGFSRLVGDAADTPFTAERGSASQFIGGIGLGYTF